MNTKQLAAIAIIIFALVVLIGLVYFMFLAPVADTTPEPVFPTQSPVLTAESVALPAPVARSQVVERASVGEDELKKIAAAFVERYGSYSNQSGYKNISELNIFMSSAMKLWAAGYIEQARQNQPDTAIYYGLSTKAVVVKNVSFSETSGRASFTVQTQRVETIGTAGNERSFQQDAAVELVQEAGVWKVDRVTWED